MRKTALILLALLLCVSLVACERQAKTGSDADGGAGGTGAGEPAAARTAASMIDTPTFTDPFDGSVAVPGSISAAVVAEMNYEGQWGPTTTSNPTATESGGALALDEVTDYKGYDAGSFVNASEGTFELLFTPAEDVLTSFTAASQPSWQKFGEYDPPTNGMLLDTIGWRAAPAGSYGMNAGFTADTASFSFGIWDGSTWYYVSHSESPWEVRPYRVTASYGPGGVRLYVDGVLAQEDTAYTGGVDTSQPLTIGQAPWYWPYGPHSILGTVREFKYSSSQL